MDSLSRSCKSIIDEKKKIFHCIFHWYNYVQEENDARSSEDQDNPQP